MSDKFEESNKKFIQWMRTQINCCTSCNSAWQASEEHARKDEREKVVNEIIEMLRKPPSYFFHSEMHMDDKGNVILIEQAKLNSALEWAIDEMCKRFLDERGSDEN